MIHSFINVLLYTYLYRTLVFALTHYHAFLHGLDSLIWTGSTLGARSAICKKNFQTVAY